ncbi:MAG: FMN-binding protein [Treponema sp.]|jgi:uncharacterized protein with FMN-binding domain|nr:FMN-binding protein [Treponema sp.]
MKIQSIPRFPVAALFCLAALMGCEQATGGGSDENGPPALTGTVGIQGEAVAGGTLEADVSALNGERLITYQWLRDNTPLPGAAEDFYNPGISDVGKTVALLVRRSGYSGTVLSEPTAPVALAGTVAARKTLQFTVEDGKTKYYSLATGNQQTNSAGAGWDVAFFGSRAIYTNSGDSAADPACRAMVWHTNKTDFEAAGYEDRVEGPDVGFDYTPYHTDTLRWITGKTQRALNVMTYAGYQNENDVDGKSEAAAYDTNYLYDKRAFYKSLPGTMPPNFEPTGQVYIIRHADGQHYSKLQVTGFTRIIPKDIYEVQVKNIYVPGSYEGQGAAHKGKITVSATFTNDGLTDLTIVSHTETVSIIPEAQVALDEIPRAIVEQQSLNIDAISGATNTSRGIIDAARNTIIQAGGYPERWE